MTKTYNGQEFPDISGVAYAIDAPTYGEEVPMLMKLTITDVRARDQDSANACIQYKTEGANIEGYYNESALVLRAELEALADAMMNHPVQTAKYIRAGAIELRACGKNNLDSCCLAIDLLLDQGMPIPEGTFRIRKTAA